MDWFLYDNGLRHERVKQIFGHLDIAVPIKDFLTTLSNTYDGIFCESN